MSAFSDLRKKLAELFQLDAAAELDFGIYRILNARRVEIEGFLDSLEPQVEAILDEALQTGTGELIAELEKVEAGLRAGGFDDAMISTAPKVRELRDKIASAGGDPTAITHEIFSLLTTFFGRYYKDGDFLSLRRYKKDTYAIPYEGEEVKLHWANADQYYIKSAETYRDYSFKLGPAPKDEKPDTRPTVTFKLTEADAEKDNNKAVAGQERRFVYQGVVEESVPTVSVGKSLGNAAETAETHGLFQQCPDRLRPEAEDERGDGEHGDAELADAGQDDGLGIGGVAPPHGADDLEVVVKSGGRGDEGDADAEPELGLDGEREDEELADESGGERHAGEGGEQYG